jgi:hypothetical protein
VSPYLPLSLGTKDGEVRQQFSLFETFHSGAVIDYKWEESAIHRVGPSTHHPLPMIGSPRRLDQQVNGISVCIEDVESEMRVAGLLPPLPPPSVEPSRHTVDSPKSPECESAEPGSEVDDSGPSKREPVEPESKHGPEVTRALAGLRKLDIAGKGRKRLKRELADIGVHVDENAVRRALPLRQSELEGGQEGGQG